MENTKIIKTKHTQIEVSDWCKDLHMVNINTVLCDNLRVDLFLSDEFEVVEKFASKYLEVENEIVEVLKNLIISNTPKSKLADISSHEGEKVFSLAMKVDANNSNEEIKKAIKRIYSILSSLTELSFKIQRF